MIGKLWIQAIFVLSLLAVVSQAFVPISDSRPFRSRLQAESSNKDEIIAARVYVKGDVQGGYYRCCVVNEVRTSAVHRGCRQGKSLWVLDRILQWEQLDCVLINRLFGVLSLKTGE